MARKRILSDQEVNNWFMSQPIEWRYRMNRAVDEEAAKNNEMRCITQNRFIRRAMEDSAFRQQFNEGQMLMMEVIQLQEHERLITGKNSWE